MSCPVQEPAEGYPIPAPFPQRSTARSPGPVGETSFFHARYILETDAIAPGAVGGGAGRLGTMSRIIIAVVVVALVLTVYAIIDCAMTDRDACRIFSKPVWMLIVLLPVAGALLWILFGKRGPVATRPAPDDDPEYLARARPDGESDSRVRDLEDQLRRLDEEIERDRRSRGSGPASGPKPGTDPGDGDRGRG